MSFAVRTVGAGVTTTFPRFPTRVVFKLQADVKETRFPGALPLLLAFGRKANKLQIDGVIQFPGMNKNTLTTTYLLPLDTAVYKELTVISAGRLYDSTAVTPNRRFVFAGISFEERSGFSRAFFYNAEFWEGSDIISM